MYEFTVYEVSMYEFAVENIEENNEDTLSPHTLSHTLDILTFIAHSAKPPAVAPARALASHHVTWLILSAVTAGRVTVRTVRKRLAS